MQFRGHIYQLFSSNMQYMKKAMTLLNPCKLLMKIQSTENALKCAYFCEKTLLIKEMA